MARLTTENEVLARRLSDDFQQFKTIHHLPDDLESSKTRNDKQNFCKSDFCLF